MNRRQALKGGFLATVASLVPLPVLQKAIQLHDVKIVIDENRNGTMMIDDSNDIMLRSIVLTVHYGAYPYNTKICFDGNLDEEVTDVYSKRS